MKDQTSSLQYPVESLDTTSHLNSRSLFSVTASDPAVALEEGSLSDGKHADHPSTLQSGENSSDVGRSLVAFDATVARVTQ